MKRYEIVRIPAGYKASLKGLKPLERDSYEWRKSHRLPPQFAVLDRQWRIWIDRIEDWWIPPFPWVIIGSLEACRDWVSRHQFDGDVPE